MSQQDTTVAKLSWASRTLTWWVDRACALLLVVLVLDVWLGIFARKVFSWNITFTEEAARYLMIWAALLAVSSAIAHREHIGMQVFTDFLPPTINRLVLAIVDTLAFVFFAVLLYYGIQMTQSGGKSFTMIFGLTKTLPFAAVPVAAALACLQLALVGIRDQLAWSERLPGQAPTEPD